MTLLSTPRTTSPNRHSVLKPALLGGVARVTRRLHPRGTDRVLRAVYDPDRRSDDHFETIVSYGDGLRMYCDTASFVEWRILFYGHYNEGVARLIRRHCTPGAVAVDIGANVGCNTLLMAEGVGATGRVIAVEPHPAFFARLRKNIELNAMQNVDAIECAVGDSEGALVLYSLDASQSLTARATVYRDNLDVGAQLADTSERFDVPVRTVDEIMAQTAPGRLDFIKLDAQGHEMPVLAGARESIATYRPHIVFKYTTEFWQNAGFDFEAARAYFNALDYNLFQVRSAALQPLAAIAENGDIFAVPR